jgi:hypothetical protein
MNSKPWSVNAVRRNARPACASWSAVQAMEVAAAGPVRQRGVRRRRRRHQPLVEHLGLQRARSTQKSRCIPTAERRVPTVDARSRHSGAKDRGATGQTSAVARWVARSRSGWWSASCRPRSGRPHCATSRGPRRRAAPPRRRPAARRPCGSSRPGSVRPDRFRSALPARRWPPEAGSAADAELAARGSCRVLGARAAGRPPQ